VSNTFHSYIILFYKMIDKFLQTICMCPTSNHLVKHIANTHRIEETTLSFYYEWIMVHNNNRYLMDVTTTSTINTTNSSQNLE
jgi:hypothetical protein